MRPESLGRDTNDPAFTALRRRAFGLRLPRLRCRPRCPRGSQPPSLANLAVGIQYREVRRPSLIHLEFTADSSPIHRVG